MRSTLWNALSIGQEELSAILRRRFTDDSFECPAKVALVREPRLKCNGAQSNFDFTQPVRSKSGSFVSEYNLRWCIYGTFETPGRDALDALEQHPRCQ